MTGRIRESDLIVPTLRLLSEATGGFLQTATLIDLLEGYFQPDGKDAQTIDGRRDSHFSQKVRNLVSHRGNSTGLETKNLAVYQKDREGWQITDYGRDYLGIADASA